MNWIVASLLMFFNSVALYLCVRKSNSLKTPQQLNNLISFHPTLEVITAFKDELTEYETSDNTVQFVLDQPLPLDIIQRMAALRVKQSKQGITWR